MSRSSGNTGLVGAEELERLRLLEAAVENARDGVVITTVELDHPGPEIVYTNPAFTEITGYTRAEVLGKSPRILQGPETDPAVLDRLRRDLQAGRPFEGETVNYRKDGTPFFMEWRVTPVRRGDGTVSHFVGFQRDATARRESERLLVQARNQWTATVDALPLIILLEDGQGRVVRCNQALADFLGLGFPDIVGRSLEELFFPDEGEVHFESFFRGPRTVRQLPGSDRWFDVSHYPLSGFERQAVGNQSVEGQGWVHVLQDISARRQAEVTAQRLLSAIEQAEEVVVILDRQGCIEYVNPAFETVLGIPPGEALGRRPWEMEIGPEDRAVVDEIAQAVAEKRGWQGRYLARRPDGGRAWEEVTLSIVRDEEGGVINFTVVGRDITERKRLESVAEAVNMMDSLGFIFTSIRHELGNPINSIKTALSVLRRRLEHYSPDEVAAYLERILEEVGRVEYLLQTLRSFNMNEIPTPDELDLEDFLQSFVKLVREDTERRGRGVRVVLRLNRPIPSVRADPRALHQVLLNLLTNAADALAEEEGGEILLQVTTVASGVELAVMDDGPGMKPEQLRNAFRPFFTSKQGGSGLGLAIVKKLIAQMGGTVDLRSRPGWGTEVVLLLPQFERQASL